MARIVTLGVISIGMIAIAGCCPTGYYGKPNEKISPLLSTDFQVASRMIERVRYNEKPSDIIDERIACHRADECGGQTDVHLRIVPSARANYVDWQRALSSGGGRTLAKITNIDNVPFGPLKLLPKETAYLYIGETAPNHRNVAVIAARNEKFELVDEAIGIRYCNYARPATAAVHLHNPPQCKDEQPTGAPRTGDDSQLIRLASTEKLSDLDILRAFIHNQALWISCSSGCCEVSFSQT